MWHLYMLECKDGSLYTGITTNLKKRLAKHQDGSGSKYTRSRLPVKLVYRKRMKSEAFARRKEAEIKSLKRKEKIELIKA
jgi:putative endonuclease